SRSPLLSSAGLTRLVCAGRPLMPGRTRSVRLASSRISCQTSRLLWRTFSLPVPLPGHIVRSGPSSHPAGSLMRLALFCLLLAPTVGHAADDKVPAPTGDAIVSKDAKLELLFTRSAKIQGGLTEGPACAPDGSIYFSDIPFGKDKGMILRFDPKTKKTTVFTDDSHKSNGLKFDGKGRLIACEGSDDGGRCVARWDVKTGKREVIADKYMG